MKLSQAISLISHPLILKTHKSTWADFGCGTGLFTDALATLLAPGSRIFAVDSNPRVFKSVKNSADILIQPVAADFIQDDLNLDSLDGIVMANSLHFVKGKIPFIQKTRNYLHEQGCLIIVEYNMDSPNPWVPYPVSFQSAATLFERSGFGSVTKIKELSSVYNRQGIYSALVEY